MNKFKSRVKKQTPEYDPDEIRRLEKEKRQKEEHEKYEKEQEELSVKEE